ncbi:hypothetical protein C5S29_00170 [ANME-1 cluster archaeon GoMg3.2]|nr:hypothetical protein [ANME-1 cluster archaeon GoMg3.2]
MKKRREKMDANEIERKLEEKKVHIKSVFHIREIGIFGSFIRGEQNASSDIDVLVEFEKGHKDFFNYMRLKHYLEELLGRKVDMVIKNAVKPRLRERIFSEVEYV